MSTIFVTRHAQSHANRNGVLSSMAPGPELTELGRQQAAAWARSMADTGVRRVYCSAYLRTRATAQALAGQLDIDLLELPDLREFDIGVWEGRRGDDSHVREHPVFQAWMGGENLDVKFECGESASGVRRRALNAFSAIAAADDGAAAVVTHGGFMAIALSLICNAPNSAIASIPSNVETRVLRFDASARSGVIDHAWDSIRLGANPSPS